MTTIPSILPEAFSHLHEAHVALCELDVLRLRHGRIAPPWPRLTAAKLRQAGACASGVYQFHVLCGRGVTLTPFMCQVLAGEARDYSAVAAALLVTVSGREGTAAAAARYLGRAETAIRRARQVLKRWRAAEHQRADERWPRLTPEAVTPWPQMSPADWRRRLNAAAERFERAAALQEARRAEDYSEIDREAAPTREAIERAEDALGLAVMHALAAFLD
jgi:hypothetical protein